MKAYKLEIIQKLDHTERLEALTALRISTPDLLKYLIKIHEDAIAKNTNLLLPVSEHTVNSWNNLLVHLRDALLNFKTVTPDS